MYPYKALFASDSPELSRGKGKNWTSTNQHKPAQRRLESLYLGDVCGGSTARSTDQRRRRQVAWPGLCSRRRRLGQLARAASASSVPPRKPRAPRATRAPPVSRAVIDLKLRRTASDSEKAGPRTSRRPQSPPRFGRWEWRLDS